MHATPVVSLDPLRSRPRARMRQALADRAFLGAAGASLALAVVPLAAVAIATLPISLPCMAFGSVELGNHKRSTVEIGASLAVSPLLALIVWRELREWAFERQDARSRDARRDGLGANELALFEAVDHADEQAARSALSRGARPDAQDADGATALILASAADGMADGCMRALLEAGADLSLRTRRGVDPLLATSHCCNFGKAHLLIKAGARPQNPSNDTSFDDYVAARGETRWASWARQTIARLEAQGGPTPPNNPLKA
jgi:hypothetical protein